MATINAFDIATTKRGATLSFKEDGKTRRIIFDKDTMPYRWLHHHEENLRLLANVEHNHKFIDFINAIRNKGYRFIANSNNPSVFYPTKVEHKQPA